MIWIWLFSFIDQYFWSVLKFNKQLYILVETVIFSQQYFSTFFNSIIFFLIRWKNNVHTYSSFFRNSALLNKSIYFIRASPVNVLFYSFVNNRLIITKSSFPIYFHGLWYFQLIFSELFMQRKFQYGRKHTYTSAFPCITWFSEKCRSKFCRTL